CYLARPHFAIVNHESGLIDGQLRDESSASTFIAIKILLESSIGLLEWFKLKTRKSHPRGPHLGCCTDFQIQPANWQQVGCRTEIEISIGAALHRRRVALVELPSAVPLVHNVDLDRSVSKPTSN